MNKQQLVLDFLRLPHNRNRTLNSTRAMQEMSARWGITLDWHEFANALDHLNNLGEIAIISPGGRVEYWMGDTAEIPPSLSTISRAVSFVDSFMIVKPTVIKAAPAGYVDIFDGSRLNVNQEPHCVKYAVKPDMVNFYWEVYTDIVARLND
jgi:hypothetical protein